MHRLAPGLFMRGATTMKLSRWIAAIATVAMIAATATPLFAQGQAQFAGTVRDASGGFVPGATVTAKNERTGETRTAVTNAQGYFVIAPLKPSTYTLSAELSGFATIEYTAMPLTAGQELTL